MLESTKGQRPNFMFKDQLHPPHVPDVQVKHRPVRATSEAVALADKIKDYLKQVRSGSLPQTLRVNGISVLEKVAVDRDGTAFFHLTDEARDTLRDGHGLPWGA